MIQLIIIVAALIAGTVFYFTKQPLPWLWFLVLLALLVIAQIQIMILRRKANKRAKTLQILRDIHDLIGESEAHDKRTPTENPQIIAYGNRTVATLLEWGRDENREVRGRLVYLMTARRLIGDKTLLDKEILGLVEGKS